MKTIILHNQSFLDLALQHTGKATNAFAIALANGKSITDDLEAGSEIKITTEAQNKDILSYYTAKGIQPATAITEVVEKCSGIGCWAIGVDFKVS
ncbi:hypothetical protein [Riemerella anatipestifer]|uniref:Uncharacterized protein n=1 Tax=Riemerella anatipestifer TaxID=34085 RepID=A0A1S7DV38_RIEAN|nr:hypothetical protein [Riemerella anatipestifer]AQY22969.1 hypothetical protein AB406_2029 [Riemerella anatipestifer]MBT0550393.1 hypothetical protein [Riemerella anatipestifer]MBT0556853.1 hypothetical protein [Riemerella anatipestifer]MBT0561157.1 hypothetical protein [Riemerella anatipestifer]MCO7355776.1 hypothetical protein [Riemerella anatipestifer]